MARCKDCKLAKNLKGVKAECYGIKIPDVRVDIECKFFEKKQ